MKRSQRIWIIYILLMLIILGGFIIYWRYPKTLTVGFLERLPLSISTIETRNAVIDGLEELKRDNINVKYKLVIKDYTNYIELRNAYKDFAEDKSIRAIIGPTLSSDASEIADLANKYKKLTLLQGVTNPDVLKASKYFISSGISDEIQVKAIEAYINYKGYKNILIIKSKTNPVYTNYIVSELKESFTSPDYRVYVFTFDIDKKEQMFKNISAKILSESEITILITPTEESATIIKEMNFKGDVLLTDWSTSEDLINLLGEKSNGILMISFCSYDVLEKSPYSAYFYVAAFETAGLLNELFLKSKLRNPIEVFSSYDYIGKYLSFHFRGGLLKNDIYIWKIENLMIKDYLRFSIESGRLQKVEKQRKK